MRAKTVVPSLLYLEYLEKYLEYKGLSINSCGINENMCVIKLSFFLPALFLRSSELIFLFYFLYPTSHQVYQPSYPQQFSGLLK